MDKPILTVTLNPALDLTIICNALLLDSVNVARECSLHAAGKGINVARVLSDLGVKVNATGIFGSSNRQPFDDFFRNHPIENHCHHISGDTRINVKVKDDKDQVTEINLPGLEPSSQELNKFRIQLLEIAEQSAWVVLAGSLPKAIPIDFYSLLIADLNQLGINVILDTSGAALISAVKSVPFLIKPNRFELEQWCGEPVTSIDKEKSVVQNLLNLGIQHIVVSDGRHGSRWYTHDVVWQAIPPKMNVVSTVGAGDSLVAGIVYGLSQGWSPDQCLVQATAIAALAVTQIGVGIPHRNELEKIRSQVQLMKLNAGEQ